MKKIIALALALLMMFALAIPAMAAEEGEEEIPTEVIKNNNTEQNLTSSTLVKFGVDQTYTVIIPAEITIDSESLDGTLTIEASNVKIPGGKSLYIAVSSTNGWKLNPSDGNTNNEAVDYGMKKMALQGDPAELAPTGEKLANGAEILVVAAGQDAENDNIGNAGESTVYLFTAGTGKVGQYSDTLTFSAAIKA